MKKRFLSLALALAMILSIMAGLSLTGNAATQTLTFSLTSNPGGWPTANSTTLTNYTYTLNSIDYTFALKNVKCNSGYLMLTSTAALGLPAIEGYKLTKVVAHNSSGCSTSTRVGISNSSSSDSYIDGGSDQIWSTQSSSYTYNLTGTDANTMYYLYVTNKNAQITSLTLTYESNSSHTHDWGDWTSNNDGTHTRTCKDSECAEEEKANCSYGEWATTTPATCSDPGTKQRICTVCDYPDIASIPATGIHRDDDGDDECDDCGEDLTGTVQDILDRAATGVALNSSSYSDWSGKSSNSDAVYAGYSAGSHDSIQLRSSNSNSGIISTVSGGKVRKIIVIWNSNTPTGRKLDIYGSNTAYTSPAQLYDDNTKGTSLGSITCGSTTALTVTDDYDYIGIRSHENAIYLDIICVVWEKPTHTHEWSSWAHDPNSNPSTHSRQCANSDGKCELPNNKETGNCTFNAGVVTTPPTCGNPGKKTYTCSVCGYQYTEAIPVTGVHTDANNNGDCDICGAKVYIVTDVLNRAATAVSGTNYKDWTGITSKSNAVYKGNSAGGNDAIQLRSSNSSGIITTASGGKVAKIIVTWESNTTSGRTLDIYGKNSVYEATSDLYNSNAQGTKLGSMVYDGTSTSTELIVEGDYEYVGLRSNSGAMYLESITIVWDHTPSISISLTTESTDNGAIKLNYYIKYANDLAKAELIPEGFGTKIEYTANGANSWTSTPYGLKVSFAVPMKNFKDTVTLKLWDSDGYPIGLTDGYAYSVQSYLNATSSFTGDAKTLIDSISYLGRTAEALFTNHSDATEYAAAKSVINTTFENQYLATYYNYKTVADVDGTGFWGSSLILEDQVTLRFYFTVGEGYTVVGSGESLTKNGSYYCYDVTGIAAKDLGEPITISIKKGSDTVTVENFSPLTYAAMVINDSEHQPEELVLLCKALYLYQAAAAAYFG